MKKQGTKGSLLLQIGGAVLTGYGIYLLFGKEKSKVMLIERNKIGGGGGIGGTIASASSGTYYPNVPSPVSNYKIGCTDPNFQEFDPSAVDVCPEPIYANGQCFGQTALVYERNLCKTAHIKGCTDPSASNYNPNATYDDGGCIAAVDDVFGCTNSEAENFNSSATQDDGSCQFSNSDIFGCTDPSASNYNPNATSDDGSCNAPIAGCTCPAASNYNPNATVDNGSCKVCNNASADNFIGQQCAGLVLNDNPSGCQIGGCTDPSATNYNPNATYNDGSCASPDGGAGASLAGTRIQQGGNVSLATSTTPKSTTTKEQNEKKVSFDGNGVNLRGYEDALDARRRIENGEFA